MRNVKHDFQESMMAILFLHLIMLRMPSSLKRRWYWQESIQIECLSFIALQDLIGLINGMIISGNRISLICLPELKFL